MIRTPRAFTPQQVVHLNDVVNTAVGRTIRLTVGLVITAETSQYENVYEPEILIDVER